MHLRSGRASRLARACSQTEAPATVEVQKASTFHAPIARHRIVMDRTSLTRASQQLFCREALLKSLLAVSQETSREPSNVCATCGVSLGSAPRG